MESHTAGCWNSFFLETQLHIHSQHPMCFYCLFPKNSLLRLIIFRNLNFEEKTFFFLHLFFSPSFFLIWEKTACTTLYTLELFWLVGGAGFTVTDGLTSHKRSLTVHSLFLTNFFSTVSGKKISLYLIFLNGQNIGSLKNQKYIRKYGKR